MSLRLYVATTSQGKLRDFRAAALAHEILIESLPGLKEIEAPEEDGATFQENAVLKALYYSRLAPGELVMADDSGIEVDALGGEPGVRSARFAADEGRTDGDLDTLNNELLLEKLADVPTAQRTARYRAVLVVARNGEALYTAQGAVEGLILEAPRGTGGFGYDPIFYLPELGQTMAEIDLDTKHGLSHRGRAFVRLLEQLDKTASRG